MKKKLTNEQGMFWAITKCSASVYFNDLHTSSINVKPEMTAMHQACWPHDIGIENQTQPPYSLLQSNP